MEVRERERGSRERGRERFESERFERFGRERERTSRVRGSRERGSRERGSRERESASRGSGERERLGREKGSGERENFEGEGGSREMFERELLREREGLASSHMTLRRKTDKYFTTTIHTRQRISILRFLTSAACAPHRSDIIPRRHCLLCLCLCEGIRPNHCTIQRILRGLKWAG